MAVSESALAEVEQTVRLSRLRVDRTIALWRIAIGLAFAAMSWVLTVRSAAPDWLPFTVLSLLACYAVVGAVLVYKVQRPWVGDVLSLLDLVGVTLVFEVMAASPGSREHPEQLARWVLYTHPGMLCVLLFMNGRRGSRRSSTRSALAAVALFLFEQYRLGVWPASVSSIVALMIVLAAVGYVSALRNRAALNAHARLGLLRRYLPSAAVSTVIATDAPAASGPRRTTATALVSDIRGYTTMSETLSPAEVMAQLNEYHAAMLAEVARHGGMVDRFLGDGLVVVFGLGGDADGVPTDAGANAAVDCATSMLQALGAVNERRGARGLPPLQIGIGVHTGAVLAGTVGVPNRRMEFTILGDAVDGAMALEAATKHARSPVLISPATRAQLRDGRVEAQRVKLPDGELLDAFHPHGAIAAGASLAEPAQGTV